MMQIFKDKKDGKYRWVTFSSNAFRDADGEIVSIKALEDDCARADEDGMYGPLRWWHLPGLELGWCDFNAVIGRTLVESGTFKDDSIAKKLTESNFQISIGFRHPLDQPDQNGVFHTIRRFERSIVPTGRVANSLTKFEVITKESNNMATIQEKLSALKTILGDDGLVAKVLAGASAAEKSADEAGLDWKELAEETAEKGKKKGKKVIVMPEDEELPEEEVYVEEKDDGNEDEDAESESDEWEDVPVIGDMPLDNFAEMLAESVDAGLQPLANEIKSVKEWQARTESGIERTAQALKERSTNEANRYKEAMDAMEVRIKALEDELIDARNALKELLGSQPNASYRASADDATIIDDNHRLKDQSPQSDPLQPFFDFVVNN